MNTMRMLKPLECDSDKTKQNKKSIFETIKDSKYNVTYTFDIFLVNLCLTHYEYIHAIQCSLNRLNILLQRRPSNI